MKRFDADMTEPVSLKSGDFDLASKKSSAGSRWPITFAILAGLIVILGRLFFFQPFNIPSGSLMPTLLVGDYVLVSKYPYGFSHFSLPAFLDLAPEAMSGRLFASQPRRGDVIVFKLPRDGETDYIKRQIGLPGDKIQMIHGRLSINGTIVERTPLPQYSIPDGFGPPVDHYEETLPGGVKYEIIQIDGEAGARKRPEDGRIDINNTAVYEVPPGQYFMMGDNRDNSLDSRVPAEQDGVGFVPFENLIGRAEVIFFSVEDGEPAWQFWRWPRIVRWNRLFHSVR